MQEKTSVLKRLFNFKLVGAILVMVLVISYLSFSGTAVKVNKDGHAIVAEKVFTSQSTKAKAIGSLKKSQNVYIYVSQNGWYQVKYGNAKGWVLQKNVKLGKYVAPPVTINKDGHATSVQKVYTSQNTKSKVVGLFKANQNMYILASQNGWYQVKYGKTTGWVIAKYFKVGKYVAPATTGKKYPDGWTAPVLKSAWSSNHATNMATLQKELGFKGNFYGIYGKQHAITVNGGYSNDEVTFKYYLWNDQDLAESYRIPVVSKELFKLYFGADATRVWNYFNSNDIPDTFTANGRTVKASFIESDGSIYIQVGKKK
jgi:uncharacterized protein YgiM (DUF1202 family)